MLGWHVNVYRQLDGSAPATQTSPEGTRIASWDTGISGLSWLDQLAADGHAFCFSSQGYPERYTAQARHVVPYLLAHKPRENERAAAQACADDEWLLVEAWDQS